VRKLFACARAGASMSTWRAAQQSWQAEIGIQGGVFKLKPPARLPTMPSISCSCPAAASSMDLTARLRCSPHPVEDKMPWRPSLGCCNLRDRSDRPICTVVTRSCASITHSPRSSTWPRADAPVAPGWRQSRRTARVVAAAGYRLRVTSRLSGRIEGSVISGKRTTRPTRPHLFPVAGISSRLTAALDQALGPATSRPLGSRRSVSRRLYEPAHRRRRGDITGFHIPGVGTM